jgi:hypothetical protein
MGNFVTFRGIHQEIEGPKQMMVVHQGSRVDDQGNLPTVADVDEIAIPAGAIDMRE